MAQSTVAKQMLVGLNLNGQGLFNVIAEHAALPNDTLYPPQANMGRFVFNTSKNQLAYCNGTTWINVGDINVSTDEKGTITINGTPYSVFTITEDGDVIRNANNQLVIQDGKITTAKLADNSITNSKLVKAPKMTIKGNRYNKESEVQDMSVDEVKALLNLSDAILDVKFQGKSIVTTLDNVYRVVELDDTLRDSFLNLVNIYLKPALPNGVATLDENGKVPMSQLKTGVAGGLVTLDETTKIPTVYLPNSVGEIINGYFYNNSFYEDSAHTILITPDISDIYVDLDTNKSYRWNGLDRFIEISESLAIGVTDNSAFQGSRGLALEERVGELSTDLTNLTTTVDGKLDKSTYNTNMSGIRNEINNKVNQSDFDTFVNEVSEMETELNNKINEKTDVNAVDSRVHTLLASDLNASFGTAVADKFKTKHGTSSQFLKGDGSLDSTDYLNSAGDTMTGNLNMGGNQITNVAIEIETSLPTENNFEGRQVSFDGRIYTYHNDEWQSIADDLGGREETREEQFTYQATANDESVKDGLAIVKSIKGNTIIANQVFGSNWMPGGGASLKEEGGFLVITVNNGAIYNKDLRQKVFVPKNNMLYVTATIIPNFNGVIEITLADADNVIFHRNPFTMSADKEIRIVWKTTVSEKDGGYIRFNILSTTVGGEMVRFKDLQGIDLTQMFGEGNEPTTVEEFEKLYPNLPTEYNAGSLLNLNADSIKSVGFNAFNGEYAKVLGGMQYYLNGNFTSLTFKENLEDEGEVIEIPRNRLYTPATNGYLVAEGSDICINLSHSGYRNGEYEPYKESIANLPIKKYFPDGMKSAGNVRDEIVWDEVSKQYMGIKRIGTRAYQIGDEDLSDVRTDKTNTYYILETPEETIIDDYSLIDYEVSDFGTEEIITDEPTTPIVADIQYGFNAVDEIRNHRFEIKDIKKQLQTIDSEVIERLAPVATSGDYNDLENKPTTLPNPNALYLSLNGTNIVSYNGDSMVEKDIIITPQSIQATKQYVVNYNNLQSGIQKDIIPATIHNCGLNPIVKTYLNGEEVLCKITISSNGDVQWDTNIVITSSSNFKVVIIGI